MLLLLRLYPKSGPKHLCDAIEANKRNLFVKDVDPVYAIRLEERREVGIVLDAKKLDSVMKLFITNINTMAEVKEVVTNALMSPIYFPPPKKHPVDLQRYIVRLQVAPTYYGKVYNAIRDLKGTGDTWVSYLSYSFGDTDILVNLIAKDRETARKFVSSKIGKIKGVISHEVFKMVKIIPLLSTPRMITHKNQFLWSAPAGSRGRREDPAAFERFAREKSPVSVVVRLFATKRVLGHWDEIEKGFRKKETEDVVPLFASLQEAKGFISVMYEARNLEVMRDYIVNDLPKVVDVSRTQTIPLLEPMYFLMPKERPKKLKRFLISLRTEPSHYHTVRSKVIGLEFPDDVFLTYLSYIMGQNDIVLSVLATSLRAVQDFARLTLSEMPEVLAYDISSQLRTTRLASRARWQQHLNKHLSYYDKKHWNDYDKAFDWTESFYKYELMSGAEHRDMED